MTSVPYFQASNYSVSVGILRAGTGTTDEVEWYEVGTDTWHAGHPLQVGRSAACACTLTGLCDARYFTFHGQQDNDVTASVSEEGGDN